MAFHTYMYYPFFPLYSSVIWFMYDKLALSDWIILKLSLVFCHMFEMISVIFQLNPNHFCCSVFKFLILCLICVLLHATVSI